LVMTTGQEAVQCA
jgi:hypothetical protein